MANFCTLVAWTLPPGPFLHRRKVTDNNPSSKRLPSSTSPSHSILRDHRPVHCIAPTNRPSVKHAHLESDPGQGIGKGLATVSETLNPIQLDVTGRIPSYLGNSSYYRNGPGLFEVEHKDGKYYVPEHWFDVIAMVHAFFIDAENGTVQYRSRRTSDGFVRAIKSVRKDSYVATNVSRHYEPDSLIDRFLKVFGPSTPDPETGRMAFNPVVSLEHLPGKGYMNARTDVNIIHRLDPDNLDTLEVYDFSQFNPDLNDLMSCSHGIYDDSTGEYFNFLSSSGPNKVDYKVFRIAPSGKAEIMTTFQDYPYYLHSFALTENYVVFIMWPCHIQLFKLLQKKSFTEAIQMKPETQTRFIVVSRKTNNIVATYEHDPFFCFHTINAFEEGDNIIIDLSRYDDEGILKQLRLDTIREGKVSSKGYPVRFTLNAVSDAIGTDPSAPQRAGFKKLANVHLEFGTLAPGRRRKSYQYIYGVSDTNGKRFIGDVVKVDVMTGETLSWSTPYLFTGEPVFVPDPNGAHEDDGCILVLVLDSAEEKSALVILDAKDMTELARATVPMALPLGFHGTFLPNNP